MSRSLINVASTGIQSILAVGPQALAWVESSPHRKLQCKQMHWGDGSEARSALEAWEKSLKQRGWQASSSVVVCLSSALVNHWLQPVPAQTQSLAELHAVASARAKLLFGGSSADAWRISGEWDNERPFVCTAVGSVWDSLFNAVRQTHKRVRTVSTLSLVLSEFTESLPKNGWLAILVEDRLHLMHRQDGYASSLRSLRLPEYGSSKDLEATVLQEWGREKIRTQHSVGKLHWFSMSSMPVTHQTSSDVVPIAGLQLPPMICSASLAALQTHHLLSKVEA